MTKRSGDSLSLNLRDKIHHMVKTGVLKELNFLSLINNNCFALGAVSVDWGLTENRQPHEKKIIVNKP